MSGPLQADEQRTRGDRRQEQVPANETHPATRCRVGLRHAFPLQQTAPGDKSPDQRADDGVGRDESLMRQEHNGRERLEVRLTEVRELGPRKTADQPTRRQPHARDEQIEVGAGVEQNDRRSQVGDRAILTPAAHEHRDDRQLDGAPS